MKRMPTILCSATGLLLVLGNAARADFIQWTFDWSRSPTVVAADTGGTGGISLTQEPLGHAAGNSDIVATNLRAFSDALHSSPDHFTNQAYSLKLSLTDDASHQSGSLTFTGLLNGMLSFDSANIINKFTGLLTQKIKLGKNDYTVTIGPFAAPGPPGSVTAGSISAHISVQPDSGQTGNGGPPDNPPPSGGDPGPVAHAPEPSSLVLGCLGLSLLGVTGWRLRWRSGRSGLGLA
jgi:hypothetical protein